ncbi:hypothetical protein PQX77_002494 [Marasmius sp. AFHP31]|nr:hypothetical protein PQX77_002494 [Marasmius sp. AFHP31]
MAWTPNRTTQYCTVRGVAKKGRKEKQKQKQKQKKEKEKKERKVVYCKDENYMKELLGDMNDWEYAVYKIDTVECFSGHGPRRGFVYFKLFGLWRGNYVKVPLRLAKHRFPIKLISFYESKIQWKTND